MDAKHERVIKALEQVNGRHSQYRALPKQPVKPSHNDDQDEDDIIQEDISSDEESRLFHISEDELDDHIQRLLMRTRTIALLKIANNTAELVLEDELCSDEGSDVEEDIRSDDTDAKENYLNKKPSIRRIPSIRAQEVEEEELIAKRLVRKLSTYLSLPKTISFRDLEEITENLLDEPHSHGDEYSNDFVNAEDHSSSYRSTSSESSAMWAQEESRVLGIPNIQEDPKDLELQQRRSFADHLMITRRSTKNMNKASSRNLLFASSKDLSRQHTSSRRNLVREASSQNCLGSSIVGLSDVIDNEVESDEEGESVQGPQDNTGGVFGTGFQEHEYTQWRTEVKEEYLAWIQAKVEAKRKRQAKRKEDSTKIPRWQLLYNARKAFTK